MENVETNQFPNKVRQVGIDLAKCLAIIFMVIIHTMAQFGVDPESTFYIVFDIIFGSILAAPVFMIAMGVGLAYSNKANPKHIIFRGINIFILGFIFNIVRTLPSFIIAGIEGDLELLFVAVYFDCLCGDILQFAGLAFILFGLLRLLKLKDYVILAISVIFSLLATFFPVFITDNVIVDFFVGLFYPTTYGEYVIMTFPLMSWFIFPCFGYWFGNLLKKTNKPNFFYLITGIIGAIISITGFLFADRFDFGFAGAPSEIAFYGMQFYDAFFCIGASVGLFALCHFICKISPLKLQNGYFTMSNSLNLIYIIHWLIIYWIAVPLTYYVGYLPLYAILLISLGIIIAATILGILLKAHIKNKMKENPNTLWRFVNAG